MALNFLFLDFNAYFASIEQQVKPELRNQPVGVLPVLADTTCCIAASYEAKAFGVKTGTMVSEAKKLCPGIKFVQANHKTYVEYHNKLVDKVNECLPVEKVHSIDEMICNLIGSERKRERAVEIAKYIKRKIKEDVGEYIRCSIGIAPNQFLAKVGTNLQKPDGLVVIDYDDLPHCLYKMELGDLYGIGRRMLVRLRRNGIYTVKDLYNTKKDELSRIWGGIEGERMYEQLRGKIVPRPATHRATVGHSHVLPPKLKDHESSFAVLNRLLQKAAMRLRYMDYYAGALGIGIRYKVKMDPFKESSPNISRSNAPYYKSKSGYEEWKHIKWKDYTTFTYTQNTIEFIKALNFLWKKNQVLTHSSILESQPTAVNVVLFNLMHEDYATLPIFENYEKNKSLYNALDYLNKRYGYSSAYFAGSHIALNSAPMRISFTQIPNIEIEDDQKSPFDSRKFNKEDKPGFKKWNSAS